MICFAFLRQFGAPDVFFPGAPACTWNCMALLSSFSLSIWRPWRFLPWSPCLHLKLHGALSSFSPSLWRPWRFVPWSPFLHLKLHGAPLVLFSVNLTPLTFSSLEPLLALETAWRPSRPFLRQFGAPDVFFPGVPACTWNCMAPLSSFSPSIWHPWRFLPWSPCLHLKLRGNPLVPSLSIWRPWRFLPWNPCLRLKLHGAPLVLFSVILAPLTFSSLELLLALETAWRPSRPFLRQFGVPNGFFPGAPACTWNCMAPSRPFLRQFGAPDIFFPGAPACIWNCMAPLSSFSPSIWRPWCFLPWSPCLHLKLHGAPLVLFSINLAPLTFSSLEPLLALETAWRPSRPFLRQFGAPDVFFPVAPVCTWNCMAPLSSYWYNFLSFFYLSCSLFLPLFLSYSLLFLFFPLFSPLSFFPSPFFSLFGAPLVTPGGPGPQSPPKIRPWFCVFHCPHWLYHYAHRMCGFVPSTAHGC